MSKAIGVLTSGGDAPGMNAAVRAVTRAALNRGMKVFGIRRGYNGLLTGDVFEMTARDVSGIIQRGGTILRTARSPEFRTEEGVAKAAQQCRDLGIDGVVVIGGDGSFRGAADLSKHGIKCIGLPGTIDNDIACTEYTIGYDTAMNTAMEMIDKIRDTAASHDRCSVIEVMGRRAGYIALNVGIAVGAEACLVLEEDYNLDEIAKNMLATSKNGKTHFVIVVAEGIGNTDVIAREIQEKTQIESRVTILGHVQRGGSPTLRDRVIASEMGYYAVELLADDKTDRVVGLKNGKIYDVDIQEALSMQKEFPSKRYEMLYNTAF